jgi:hypothetical protein
MPLNYFINVKENLLLVGHRPWDRPAWGGNAGSPAAAVPVQQPTPHPTGP